MIKKWLISWAERIIATDKEVRGRLSEEHYVSAMSKMHQNPAVQQYLDGREQQLINLTVEAFITNQAENAHRTAGRLVELRALRTRMRVCYNRKRQEVNKKTSSAAA